MTHYIGMAGLHGCMPMVCFAVDSRDGAVDSLAETHELGRDRTRELRRNGTIELNIQRDGNEYAEVVDCECNDLGEHNDT